MSPDHKLAEKDFIEGPDIAGEDFITYTRIPEPDREYARLFRPSNSYPNWVETVEVVRARLAGSFGSSQPFGLPVRAIGSPDVRPFIP